MKSSEIDLEIDHLFRHNSGQMVAVLVRIFGISQIDRIEDAVQDALLKALKHWPIYGVPENPSAWLIQVAKNRLLDVLRRDKRLTSEDAFESESLVEADDVYFESELAEDQLRLIFACCHPSISPDSQIAITLKTVGGFNNEEIASAFLAKRTAIDKLLTRAKAQLKKQRSSFSIPSPDKIASRVKPVLKVLYLMFNEGYMASGGSQMLRRDLCFEALRLGKLMESHQLTSGPKVRALLALFCFQASRFESRTDDSGLPILLPDQARESWDQSLITEGFEFLLRSAEGDELSEYHLEAEIASYHARAKSYSETDWNSIRGCYDLLEKMTGSPVVRLNRIYAMSRAGASKAAYLELREMNGAEFEKMYQYHLVLAELALDNKQAGLARDSYQAACDLTTNKAIKSFVRERMKRI